LFNYFVFLNSKIYFMKRIIFSLITLITITACAQNNAQPASPPASVSKTTKQGATITINYSQPAVKGRTIGKDVEPMAGKVWRTGANKATVFEINKDVKVEGQALAAGKYSLFTIMNGDEWTIIFNKTWDQWGAMGYKEADDALRVKVKSGKASPFAERMTFAIAENGKVSLMWADIQVDFSVK
jgi:hypothetical protein